LKLVKELLVPWKTYCLLGSSGVGKTTLINNLLDEVRLKTHSVREKNGKGRHITTRRQLINLKSGAMMQGCSILAALKDGIISQERYQNFIKLNKESAFYEMSYLEKKRKDKKFGKFVKSVMKEKKYRR
jgi:ribosome biogenesis GTPase